MVRYLVGERDFSFQYTVQTDSGAHPLSYSLYNEGSFSGRCRGWGLKLTTHIHLVLKLRMSAAIPLGTAVAEWLAVLQIGRSLVRSHMVPLEFFIDIKSFRSHYGPGIDSASNRNEYPEYFLGVETAGA